MRPIKQIHGDKPSQWIGDGFNVKTLINYVDTDPEFNYTHTDPFLLFDYGEPTIFAPNPNYDSQPRGIGQHPHKGFETVTIAYAGEVSHADSTGGRDVILEGDVQWMTAGRGIMHEEFHSPAFGQRGGLFSMVQMWINLPQEHKLTEAKYQALKRTDMTVLDLYDQPTDTEEMDTQLAVNSNDQKTPNNKAKIGTATIIAGCWQDKTGIATTFTPINLWDIELCAAGSTMLDIPNSHNVMMLVQEGELLINNSLVNAGQLIQFEAPIDCNNGNEKKSQTQKDATDTIELTYPATSNDEQTLVPVKLLLMSGEPIGEPVAGYGPFVMTTQEELKQTFHDYKTGNFG